MSNFRYIGAPHSPYLLNVSAENMTHRDLPTVKSRVLMDIWGIGCKLQRQRPQTVECIYLGVDRFVQRVAYLKNCRRQSIRKIGSSSANTNMYDFYSTNFGYQAPSYPSPYTYNSPEMSSSHSYRFPTYGFHAGPIHTTGVPSYQPCERVPNVAGVDGIRMADNTPSRPDFCTKTLHHFPPTPPPNMNTVNCSNESQRKQCIDKLLEDSDEGRSSLRFWIGESILCRKFLNVERRISCFY